MPTIRDVAKRAGVSPSAVSWVLNGRHDQVGSETLARIQAAIADLDYRPSHLARGLRTGTTKTIGVLVAHMRRPVKNFIVSVMVTEARRMGYDVLIWDELVGSGTSEGIKADQIASMASYNVEGIIVSSGLPADAIATLHRAGIPVVAVDHMIEGISAVAVDWPAGAAMAVSHFHSLGRKRLLYVGHTDPPHLDGVHAALPECPNLELCDIRFVGTATDAYHNVVEAVRANLAFDCIYVSSDLFAIGVYRALQETNRRIPQDVAVIGFDDTFGAFFTPALTTLAQPFKEIGQHAVRRLLAQIDRKHGPSNPRTTLFPPRLVIRQSCGAAQPSAEALLHGIWEHGLAEGLTDPDADGLDP